MYSHSKYFETKEKGLIFFLEMKFKENSNVTRNK